LRYEYHWADGVEIKRPIKVSAPEYVDRLMRWIQDQLDDEKIFPSTVDVPFPKEFKLYVKNIFRRMFRVYAHIYYHVCFDLFFLPRLLFFSSSQLNFFFPPLKYYYSIWKR
jgi:hypothetical protein